MSPQRYNVLTHKAQLSIEPPYIIWNAKPRGCKKSHVYLSTMIRIIRDDKAQMTIKTHNDHKNLNQSIIENIDGIDIDGYSDWSISSRTKELTPIDILRQMAEFLGYRLIPKPPKISLEYDHRIPAKHKVTKKL